MAKIRVRDNFGSTRRHAAVVVAKELQKLADEMDVNLKKDLKNKLYDTYITNVYKSWNNPRYTNGGKYTYHHTGKFIESIGVKTEESKRGKYAIKVTIDDSYVYDNGKNAYDVYTFLTHGTEVHEPGYNPFISGTTKTENGRTSIYKSAKRRPMEARTFEEDTREEMIQYINELTENLKNKEYRGNYFRNHRKG